jgi:tetraacyldisaccharide-1-P 4'-kinase
VRQLEQWLATTSSDAVVCTLKDLVKLPYAALANVPLWGLAVELEFLTGRAELETLLLPLASRVGT